jgi:hypothetical protein
MLQWLTALWLPIVLSAVGIFAASALIHMVFQWHHSDYKQLGNEDEVRAALRAGNTKGGGEYTVPYCSSPKAAGTPEMQKKFEEGPIGVLMIWPPGAKMNMGKTLAQWFVFTLVVSAIVGYVAYKAILVPSTWGQVARLTGGLTFLAYAAGSCTYGIWWGKPWKSVAKDVLDAAIYATITAVAFASLWTR